MSNNDVAEIQATLKNIGVTAAPEQIDWKGYPCGQQT